MNAFAFIIPYYAEKCNGEKTGDVWFFQLFHIAGSTDSVSAFANRFSGSSRKTAADSACLDFRG